jgi:hypothetical protein
LIVLNYDICTSDFCPGKKQFFILNIFKSLGIRSGSKTADLFFKKINNSPSSEMKNMAMELSLQIVQSGDLSTIDERYEKIDNIFVKNTMQMTGYIMINV